MEVTFEDSPIREYLWRQVWIRRAYDRDQQVGNNANLPMYFGVLSNDGKFVYMAKHGVGDIGLAITADTMPLEVKNVLGVL